MKVPNDYLLKAGLEELKRQGREVTKVPGHHHNAMIYAMADGKTVRGRTCNDHILVCLADEAKEGARLNIEGTDFLLIVMPRVPRTLGAVVAYLVPTDVAVRAVRAEHKRWLASKPNTGGHNRTWNLSFDDGDSPGHGFARHWAQYRLTGPATQGDPTLSQEIFDPDVAQLTNALRNCVAAKIGRPMSAVTVKIELRL
jgi:hypothetical protein